VNGNTVGTAALDGSGNAALTFTLTPGGSRTITATYGGDSTFTGSSGQVVVASPTLTAALTAKHAATKYGWFRSAVTVTFSCTAGSGAVTCPKPVTLTAEGKKVHYSGTAVDADGGRAVASGKVKIDLTKPTLKVKGAKNGATYPKLRHLKCKAHDALSHVASCVIHTHRHGNTVKYKAKAKDKAGNKTVSVGHYDVVKVTKA
jgi:hypothetical protein